MMRCGAVKGNNDQDAYLEKMSGTRNAFINVCFVYNVEQSIQTCMYVSPKNELQVAMSQHYWLEEKLS